MKKLALGSEIFSRGVEEIVTPQELERLLASGRQLRIKHGIDATSPELHLGHAANLWKIRALQECGHRAVILLGDITTRIGDPTGRSRTRPALSPKDISRNIRSIEAEVKKILLTDWKLLEVHRSSEWYSRMTLPKFLALLSLVTHAKVIGREMFKERLKSGSEIFMHELIYPVLQGYDSVRLKSDLTIIGSDQLFNEHMGRFLQEKFGQPPQTIAALKILPGLDGGEKMSKSLGNHISLVDSPRDKFGKAMRVPDSLIMPYLESYTDVAVKEVERIDGELKAGLNPMEAKLFFAEALVRRYHGVSLALKERRNFLETFSKKIPSGIDEVRIVHGDYLLSDLLFKLRFVRSRSEARRMIVGGAVDVDGKNISRSDATVGVRKNTWVRVGKRKFVRIK